MPFYFKGLGGLLGRLADDWSAANPVFPIAREFGEAGAAFPKELERLHQRIERDLLSRILRAPELKAAPLAAQPLDAALDGLCNKLAGEEAWQRLFETLKTRALIGLLPEKGPASKEGIMSIQAFLAGQNFEMAEDWTDAAASYKTVIRHNSDGTPIKEATERLEILKKQHSGSIP